ncbi:hypothetical protein AYL99_11827 [Fonsecaea erecta]|uniref:Reverse transcriptase RNase H-like domain-containing protein n=1 Tax=Fonsecaea erecta TaxID=1367422 RepID=A0A178Z2K1_9EURO|nr:hypothetical protein AYL99_11827 [Fonsecaea erecta]OAP53947.1 hypothetical protein AYL99_11827 [Fonsecaea erecta]
MEALRIALATAPALVSVDYDEGAGLFILAFDASIDGWGAVLTQSEQNLKRRHPARVQALLKSLKKFKPWLYGVAFLVKTDSMTLADKLNQPATDPPGVLVRQCLHELGSSIFEVRQIPGVENVVADAPARRPATEEDIAAAGDMPWGSLELAVDR